MPSDDALTRASKLLSLLSELGKLLAMGAAALFMVGALAAPTWVKGKLIEIGVKPEISLPFVKLIWDEAPKANAHNMQASEALTQLEIAIADAGPGQRTESLLKNVGEAKKALDEQSQSLVTVAGAAGLEPKPPSTAWVYVGYYSSTGALARLGDRLDPAGVVYDAGKLRSLVLSHDATVSSNGDDCTRTEIGNVPAFDPAALKNKFVVVKASRDPVKVIKTSECPSGAGQGKQVFAEIQVPASRVRYAELAAIRP